MFTLSQLVDSMVEETKRHDMVQEIARFVNQTVRECHFSQDRRAALLLKPNFRELALTATSESGFAWEVPNPTVFQHLSVVQYPDVIHELGEGYVYAKEVQPGPHVNRICAYYYRVGDGFAFSGYGGNGARINLGYFEFPKSLKYFPDDETRPAEYDELDGWTYPAGAATPEDQLIARESTTNWLLLRWNQIIAEGVRAKIYKRTSDTERARTSYSMYESLRQGLWTSESMVSYQG